MDGDDQVLRGGVTSSKAKKLAELRLKEFRDQATFVSLPEKADLERAVEERETCKKCKGGIRCILLDAQPGDRATHDIEILVEINCRDAECNTTSRTWRPWRKVAPMEL